MPNEGEEGLSLCDPTRYETMNPNVLSLNLIFPMGEIFFFYKISWAIQPDPNQTSQQNNDLIHTLN